MGFKRAFKKFRKAVGLPAVTLGNVAKVGAAVGTGGIGAGLGVLGTAAIKSKLRSAGAAAAKRGLGVLRTKAEKALARKTHAMKPNVTVSPAATTMPGGAPLAKLPSAAAPRRRRKGAAAPRSAKAPRKAAGGGRKPPKGGKDLKALSASWKAAGKPGRWIDWVKAH